MSTHRTAFALVAPVESRRQPRRHRDLRTIGARGLDTHALVRLVCGRVDDGDVAAAAAALTLEPQARDAVLLRSPLGPRLLAAMELGRRACLVPVPTAAQITGPAAVVAALASRMVDDVRPWLAAVDVRLRIAGVRAVEATIGGADDDDAVAAILQQTLALGCRRVVLVQRRPGPAIVDVSDAGFISVLRARAASIGVIVLDHVICGDDGWASLLRLGVLEPSADRRYR